MGVTATVQPCTVTRFWFAGLHISPSLRPASGSMSWRRKSKAKGVVALSRPKDRSILPGRIVLPQNLATIMGREPLGAVLDVRALAPCT